MTTFTVLAALASGPVWALAGAYLYYRGQTRKSPVPDLWLNRRIKVASDGNPMPASDLPVERA